MSRFYSDLSRYVQKCTLMRFMNCMIDITRCPLTLILTKTHIIRSNIKSYENDKKGLFYMKYPNSGLGAFLDISVDLGYIYPNSELINYVHGHHLK